MSWIELRHLELVSLEESVGFSAACGVVEEPTHRHRPGCPIQLLSAGVSTILISINARTDEKMPSKKRNASARVTRLHFFSPTRPLANASDSYLSPWPSSA